MKRKIEAILSLLCLICFASFEIPQDANGSWTEIKERGLKVGLATGEENNSSAEEISQTTDSIIFREIKLLKDFSTANSIDIHFISGTESVLMDSLEHFKLHVVAGNINKETVWAQKATATIPYDNKGHVFLVPKGENKLLVKLEQFIEDHKDD